MIKGVLVRTEDGYEYRDSLYEKINILISNNKIWFGDNCGDFLSRTLKNIRDEIKFDLKSNNPMEVGECLEVRW